jgi:hypothetical protein
MTQESDPYVRHRYNVILTDGQSVVIDDYEDVYAFWRMIPPRLRSHVEILDVKPKKNKKPKGNGGFG